MKDFGEERKQMTGEPATKRLLPAEVKGQGTDGSPKRFGSPPMEMHGDAFLRTVLSTVQSDSLYVPS